MYTPVTDLISAMHAYRRVLYKAMDNSYRRPGAPLTISSNPCVIAMSNVCRQSPLGSSRAPSRGELTPSSMPSPHTSIQHRRSSGRTARQQAKQLSHRRAGTHKCIRTQDQNDASPSISCLLVHQNFPRSKLLTNYGLSSLGPPESLFDHPRKDVRVNSIDNLLNTPQYRVIARFEYARACMTSYPSRSGTSGVKRFDHRGVYNNYNFTGGEGLPPRGSFQPHAPHLLDPGWLFAVTVKLLFRNNSPLNYRSRLSLVLNVDSLPVGLHAAL